MPIWTEALLATFLILLFIVCWRFMPPRRVWVGLATTIFLFILLSVLVINSAGSPLNPRFDQSAAAIELWQRLIATAWWLLGARTLLAIGSAIVLAGRRSREAKLASDLVSGGVYLAALLVIVNTVFNVPIGGLVATSGVIAIVLGLALQNTLADVFAGIAVQIEGPVALGDRIWVEGPLEGEVVQINWRSVHIRTDSNDIAIIPHSVIAKSRIINRSQPTARRGDSIEISCNATVRPDHVIDLLRRALLLCPSILKEPAPSAALVGLGARRNKYAIGFSVASSSLLWNARTTLMREVARQFRYEGIQPARPAPDRLREKAAGNEGQQAATSADLPHVFGPAPLSPAELLDELPMFQELSPAHRQQIVEQLKRRVLEPQDIIFSQGGTEASLFVIASGVLEVTRRVGETNHMVGRIGPGDYIGEIGLLTGAPHAATVTALTHCLVYELCKSTLAPILAEEPGLVSAFELSARRGQETLARMAAAAAGSHAGSQRQLLARIRAFFDLPA